MGYDLPDADADPDDETRKKTKDYSQYSDAEALEILRQADARTLKKKMWDDPKDFVYVIIQGECLIHKRGPLKQRGRKRPIAKGFDSDIPDDEDL